MAEVKEKLYNANDGVTGRDGGPYLDEEEARYAERNRARVEKREPDEDNLQPTAGIQLNTARQQLFGSFVPNSQTQVDHSDLAVGAVADDKDAPLTVVAERPVTEDRKDPGDASIQATLQRTPEERRGETSEDSDSSSDSAETFNTTPTPAKKKA